MALLTFLLGSIIRYKVRPFSVSSLSSQFLENRMLYWGSHAFHIGIVVLFFGHLIGFLFPSGVISFTVSLAKEVAAGGIRVNAVAPGIMYTDMTAELLELDMEHYKKQIPIGRIAELEDRLDFTERLLAQAQAQQEPMKEVGRGS